MSVRSLPTSAAEGAYENRGYWTSLHTAHRGALRAVGYPALGEGFNRATYRMRRSAVIRLARRRPGLASGRLLEAAAGVGAYAAVWRRFGVADWTGLDISEEAVRYCRLRHGEGRFFVQDLACEAWAEEAAPEDSFALVAAIDVLYHLVEQRAFETALGNLSRRVQPGGRLLVSDVFVETDRRVAAHVRRRPLAAYQRVLGERFELEDREPVFAVLGDPTPRAGHRADRILCAAWRLAAGVVRAMPGGPVRDLSGAAAGWLLRPIDGLLRGAGMARGANLELALFRRRPDDARG